MSGEPCNWEEADAASHGEGVPRCNRPGCWSPLELDIGPTLIHEWCQAFHHKQHAQAWYLSEFAEG